MTLKDAAMYALMPPAAVAVAWVTGCFALAGLALAVARWIEDGEALVVVAVDGVDG